MYPQGLKLLRDEMQSQNVQGFLVPQTDAFMGEYIPACAQRLAWVSGFTGSSGEAVILQDKACAITNAIYTLQIKQQVSADLFEIEDVTQTKLSDWIKRHTEKTDVIAFDPWLHTDAHIQELEEKGLILKPVDDNLIDKVWKDRPEPPAEAVFLFSDQTAGRTAQEKRELIAQELKKTALDAFVLSDPQSIAWLLNVRSTDVPCTPLPLSYAVIYMDSTIDWFIQKERVPKDVQNHLGQGVRLIDPVNLKHHFMDIGKKEKVGLDHKRSPIAFKYMLEQGNCKIVDIKDPCINIRACKTDSEIEAMKVAHIRDGKALTKCLKWIEEEAPKGELTELIVDAKLREFREATGVLKGLSFESICGWKENGAIVHYRVTEETSLPIKGQGLLLLDTGGQYLDGTTDVTRTVSIGEPSAEEKHHFTLVLKGHIAVATAIFPEGTMGTQIDMLARQALWKEGIDYGHGTGHGVGCYLSVHEAAASISPRSTEVFKAGMIISNEPGYYKEGAYGIRIESLVLVVETGQILEDGRKLLGFETITMVPLDEKLIDGTLLTEEELRWVREYQMKVKKALV